MVPILEEKKSGLFSLRFPLLIAWLLLTVTSYRIHIATVGLASSSSSSSSSPATTRAAVHYDLFDVDMSYEAEFLPIPILSESALSVRSDGDGGTTTTNTTSTKFQHHPLLRVTTRTEESTFSLSNVRSIDETNLPYQCGILFFYHIACTGGSSINRWLGKLKDNNPNVTYYTHWGRKGHIVEQTFLHGMENQVNDLGTNEWRIVHAHGHSLALNSSEAYLYQWRERVEQRGCAFVAATMLRDAVGHTISQSKGMINPNITLDEFIQHLEPENYNRHGYFNTQLDYLLYNGPVRNPYNVSREEKVRRGLELLARHFDVVLVSDHERFVDIVLKVTGWKGVSMRHANSYNGELNFSERELRKIQTLTEENGDVMFIDAVKHIYYGHLDYVLA